MPKDAEIGSNGDDSDNKNRSKNHLFVRSQTYLQSLFSLYTPTLFLVKKTIKNFKQRFQASRFMNINK